MIVLLTLHLLPHHDAQHPLLEVNIFSLREASNPTPHCHPQCNWGRCHVLIPCAMGDLSETQVAMVVRCSSGVHCSVGSQVVPVLLPLPA